MAEFIRLVANFAGKTRVERLEGRRHIVAPVALLPKEGVLNGSEGAFFYPEDENRKRLRAWNGRPVVVYHPVLAGNAISACDPLVFNTRRCGTLFNAKMDDKVRAEAWFDEEKTEQIDKRVYEALQEEQMLECSSGLFAVPDKTPGVFNNVKYDAIARDQEPDHLAVLPDQIGAYSIEQGGGILQTNQRRLAVSHLACNAMSFTQIQDNLLLAIREKVAKPGVEWWGYIVEVWNKFFIYCTSGQLFKQSYKVQSDDTISLVGEPQEVVRYSEYRTPDGTPVVNVQSPPSKENEMPRKEQVDELIANKNSGWAEEDRDELTKMGEKSFTKVLANAKKAIATPPPEVTPPPTPAPAPAPAVAATTTTAPAQTAPTINQLWEQLKQADPAFAEMVSEGLQIRNQEKTQLIDTIMKAPGNRFTKEQLDRKPLGDIQAIALLANGGVPPTAPAGSPPFTPLYTGMAGAPPVTNSTHKETPLASPKYKGHEAAAGKN